MLHSLPSAAHLVSFHQLTSSCFVQSRSFLWSGPTGVVAVAVGVTMITPPRCRQGTVGNHHRKKQLANAEEQLRGIVDDRPGIRRRGQHFPRPLLGGRRKALVRRIPLSRLLECIVLLVVAGTALARCNHVTVLVAVDVIIIVVFMEAGVTHLGEAAVPVVVHRTRVVVVREGIVFQGGLRRWGRTMGAVAAAAVVTCRHQRPLHARRRRRLLLPLLGPPSPRFGGRTEAAETRPEQREHFRPGGQDIELPWDPPIHEGALDVEVAIPVLGVVVVVVSSGGSHVEVDLGPYLAHDLTDDVRWYRQMYDKMDTIVTID